MREALFVISNQRENIQAVELRAAVQKRELHGEGKGLDDLTRKRYDFVVSLPTTGPVKSLNVSVAAGVVLFEVLRQRHAK